MPTYIIMMNYTEDGIKKIKEAATRTENLNKMIVAAGGKVIGHYGTMGQYDRISIVEMPNDDAMGAMALRMGVGGSVRTTTIKAWPMEDFLKIINKLP
jgi:uncharacterized protein with GYD domain